VSKLTVNAETKEEKLRQKTPKDLYGCKETERASGGHYVELATKGNPP